MQFPNFPTGHLYQYLTVLGAMIVMVSCYSAASVLESHDQKLRAAVEHVLVSEEVKADVKQFWMNYLQGRKSDAMFILHGLTIAFFVGIGFFLIGVHQWYFKVQKVEDNRRELENERLQGEVKKSSRIAIYTGSENSAA